LLEAAMNSHISCPSRTSATITGYRRLCDELESENQSLRIQNLELRAQLCERIGPTFGLLDGFATGHRPGRSATASKSRALAH
jgi:hypothetical protein